MFNNVIIFYLFFLFLSAKIWTFFEKNKLFHNF